MKITQCSIVQAKQQKGGFWRVRFLYTFVNGAQKEIGPFNVDDLEAGNDLMISISDKICIEAQFNYERALVLRDAEIKNYEHASGDQIARAYLVAAMDNETTYLAFMQLSKVVHYLGSATSSATKARLNISHEFWLKCKARFNYLDAKAWKNSIGDYLQTQDDDRAGVWEVN